MNSKTFLLAAILLCLPSFLFSQNVQKTLEKPFESWSQDEASKIAYGLPWANQYQSEEGLAAASQLEQRQGQADTNISGGTRGSMQRGLGPQPLTIQLRSALPIRQALYRLRQIAAGYYKLS